MKTTEWHQQGRSSAFIVKLKTLQIPRQKYTSEQLFYRTASSGFCQISVIVLIREKKQKQFFIPPLCLIRLKSCNCIKIVKIIFIHDFAKKTTPILLSSVSLKFCNIRNRSSHQRCSIKKVFLEFSQNPQENTCARVSFLRTFFTEHIWTHLLSVRKPLCLLLITKDAIDNNRVNQAWKQIQQ